MIGNFKGETMNNKEFDFNEFIKICHFTGDICSSYADKPIKEFFEKCYYPHKVELDKTLAEGGYKITTREREIEEEILTVGPEFFAALQQGKVLPKKKQRKIIKETTDNKIDTDCINMALYVAEKVNGVVSICAIGQGHSIVFHLNEQDEVCVTCPYLNGVCNGKYSHFSLKFEDYIKKFPDEREENVGFSIYTNINIDDKNFTLNDLMNRKNPDIFIDVTDKKNLSKKLEELRQVLLELKAQSQETLSVNI